MSRAFDRLKTLAGQKETAGTTKDRVSVECLKSISYKFRKLVITSVDGHVQQVEIFKDFYKQVNMQEKGVDVST